jgi:hypothetical protein
VARQLRTLGFEATALTGGYAAWRARFPVEPKGTPSAPPSNQAPAATPPPKEGAETDGAALPDDEAASSA